LKRSNIIRKTNSGSAVRSYKRWESFTHLRTQWKFLLTLKHRYVHL